MFGHKLVMINGPFSDKMKKRQTKILNSLKKVQGFSKNFCSENEKKSVFEFLPEFKHTICGFIFITVKHTLS